MELQVNEVLTKLESQTAAASASERRAADLIKAGQLPAVNSQRELENVQAKLETANRMALHWQEQATLANEAVRQTEQSLELLRAEAAALPSNVDSEVVEELRAQITALKLEHAGQIRELEARHAAALEQDRAAPQAAIDAVHAEAAEVIQALKASHAAEIQALMEEKARLDSALRCIKEMMHGHSCASGSEGGTPTAAENGSRGDLHRDGHADIYTDGPALGIPIQPLVFPSFPPLDGPNAANTAAANGGQSPPPAAAPVPGPTALPNRNSLDEGTTWSGGSYDHLSPHRPPSGASSGAISLEMSEVTLRGAAAGRARTPGSPPRTMSPAPADYTIFDAAGARRIGRMYDLVNPLRPNSSNSLRPSSGNSADDVLRELREQREAMEHRTYRLAAAEPENNKYRTVRTSNQELFSSPRQRSVERLAGVQRVSPRSRNRVVMAGGGCGMVDFQGDRPDTVTEASMSRILDAPPNGVRGTAAGTARRAGDSYILRRLTASASEFSSYPPNNNREATVGQETPHGPLRMPPPTAARPTTTQHSHHPGCISAPVSATKGGLPGVEEEDCEGQIHDSPWALGSLSLPGSKTSTPTTGARKPRFSLGTEEEDDSPVARLLEDEVRGDMMPTATATVTALDEASPSTANFLAQYMADHVSVRASMQIKPRPKSGSVAYRALTPRGNKGKIPAVRRSAPGVLKRSSFLQRPLVSEDDLFGKGK